MNAIEMTTDIKTMSKENRKKLLVAIEERMAEFRKQVIAEMVKKTALGDFVSYLRGKVEIIGEVVAMNKKYLFLEMQEGNVTHKRTLTNEDVHKVYQTKPTEQKPVEVTKSKK